MDEPKDIPNWLDRVIYNGIGLLHKDLSVESRMRVVSDLARNLGLFESKALEVSAVRSRLYSIYNSIVLAEGATSTMSSKFNMSKKGLNKELGAEIDAAFSAAYASQARSAEILRESNLSFRLLFSPEIIELAVAGDPSVKEHVAKVKSCRERLFISTLRLVSGLAKKHASRLEGGKLEWSDLVQEGVMASRKACNDYHPAGAGSTFTSFIYTSVNGTLNKRVSENSRTVEIPRSTLDRYTRVYRSIDALDIDVRDVVGAGSLRTTLISEEQVQQIVAHANTNIKGGRLFTEREVYKLLENIQDECSLDLELEFGEVGKLPMIEQTPSDTQNAEDQLDAGLLGARLMRIIRDFTTNEEYTVFELRYGGNRVLNYKETSDAYVRGRDMRMNKGRVSEIDRDVLSRLKDASDRDPELRRSLLELLDTCQYQ